MIQPTDIWFGGNAAKPTLNLRRKPMATIHFVGFKGDEYNRAITVFGPPDFVHRLYDDRAKVEIMATDIAVFANGEEDKVRPWTYDDSAFF